MGKEKQGTTYILMTKKTGTNDYQGRCKLIRNEEQAGSLLEINVIKNIYKKGYSLEQDFSQVMYRKRKVEN